MYVPLSRILLMSDSNRNNRNNIIRRAVTSFKDGSLTFHPLLLAPSLNSREVRDACECIASGKLPNPAVCKTMNAGCYGCYVCTVMRDGDGNFYSVHFKLQNIHDKIDGNTEIMIIRCIFFRNDWDAMLQFENAVSCIQRFARRRTASMSV